MLEQNEKPTVSLIHSVGWITAKDKAAVRLHPNISEWKEEGEAHGIGSMTIPMSAVRRVKRLTVWAFS